MDRWTDCSLSLNVCCFPRRDRWHDGLYIGYQRLSARHQGFSQFPRGHFTWRQDAAAATLPDGRKLLAAVSYHATPTYSENGQVTAPGSGGGRAEDRWLDKSYKMTNALCVDVPQMEQVAGARELVFVKHFQK